MSKIDDLIGNADVFPVLAKRDYFNHAGASPMPRPVGDAVRAFLTQFEHDGFVGFDFFKPIATLKQTAASMINAGEDEVAIVTNTGEAISMVALGLNLKPGDRVVINEAEYPANVYPWQEACARVGAELVTVPETVTDDGGSIVREDDLIAACEDPNTKVLAVSHVQWGSGQRMDLEKLGSACRERGILFSVDVIQSMGVMPIDVEAAKIDFLQAGGHKWMLGTMGAGVFYVRRGVLETLRPAIVGAMSVVDPLKWERIDYTLQPDARRFEFGTPAMASIIAVGTGLSLLAECGIDAVADRVLDLGDRFAAGVTGMGCTLAVSREDRAACGGAVCFAPAAGEEASKALYEALSKEDGIELASRCGRVRFAPHFYNTEAQVDRLLERIEARL